MWPITARSGCQCQLIWDIFYFGHNWSDNESVLTAAPYRASLSIFYPHRTIIPACDSLNYTPLYKPQGNGSPSQNSRERLLNQCTTFYMKAVVDVVVVNFVRTKMSGSAGVSDVKNSKISTHLISRFTAEMVVQWLGRRCRPRDCQHFSFHCPQHFRFLTSHVFQITFLCSQSRRLRAVCQ